MKVRWTTPASQDFTAAGEWFAERDPGAARTMLGLVLEQVAMLADFPQLGHSGRVAGTRELVVAGTPFILAYQIRREGIAVVGFLHAKRKWPERF